MDLITSWRHLFTAVLRLGANEGTVDQRLREAYRGELVPIARNGGLPDHLQPEYAQLMAALEDLLEDEDKIDTRRASRLAKRVVKLYDRVSREL